MAAAPLSIPEGQLSPDDLDDVRAQIVEYTMPDVCIILRPGSPIDDGMGGTKPGPPEEETTPCSQKPSSGAGSETLQEGIQQGAIPWTVRLPYGTRVDRNCGIEIPGGAGRGVPFEVDIAANKLLFSGLVPQLQGVLSSTFPVGQRCSVSLPTADSRGQLPSPLQEMRAYYIHSMGEDTEAGTGWVRLSLTETEGGEVLDLTTEGVGTPLLAPRRTVGVSAVMDGGSMGLYTKVLGVYRS